MNAVHITEERHEDFLKLLESGALRAALKDARGWHVNKEIKQQILDLFRDSSVIDMPGGFRDKAPFITRIFKEQDKVRFVPGGSSVRAGAHVGHNVVIMPPSYINIGAYVDDNTIIDSHVLVGSCAQIGRRVHLSAAVQIGGVLEPVGHRPVIIEDDCFVGAGVIIVEGVLVRARAVIAPGVVLSASTPIYDLINKTELKGEVPENAVVVPGTRGLKNQPWANERSLHLACAIIVKYRDEKTEAALALEESLRL